MARGPRGASSSTAAALGRSGSGTDAPWAELVGEIERCRRCPLHRTRCHVVVYRGGPRPKVLFVGEAPGAEEDKSGVPFVGRSGRRLDRAIAELGLGPDEFGIVNLLKCRPTANRFDPAAARTCRSFLDRQMALLRPRLLVPLGARALAALDPSAPPITASAGRLRDSPLGPIFPLFHPAAALHAPARQQRWTDDVAALGRHLADGSA